MQDPNISNHQILDVHVGSYSDHNLLYGDPNGLYTDNNQGAYLCYIQGVKPLPTKRLWATPCVFESCRINNISRSLHIYMKQHYIMESKQLLHILRRNWIYIYHVMTYFAGRWHKKSTILLNYTSISHNFIITFHISFRLLLQNLNYQKLRYLDHHT